MPNAVVPGGLGGAGSWMVEHPAKYGWDVVCVALYTPDASGVPVGDEFRAGDLTDLGEA